MSACTCSNCMSKVSFKIMYLFVLLLYFCVGAIEAVTHSAFGADTVPFTHTYLSCQGTESQISDCYGFTQYQTYAHNCKTTRAAGVKCLGMIGGVMNGRDRHFCMCTCTPLLIVMN